MFIDYGYDGLIRYLLRYVCKHVATFKQLKDFYELVVSREISGGTVSNTLSRISEKSIIT